MEDSVFDVFLEEAICTPLGLPPGMMTAARLVLGGAGHDGKGPSAGNGEESTPEDAIIDNANHLSREEERYYESLVNRISAAVANEAGGTSLSRVQREEFARQVVNHLANSGSQVSTRKITLHILRGSDEDIVQAIGEIANSEGLI